MLMLCCGGELVVGLVGCVCVEGEKRRSIRTAPMGRPMASILKYFMYKGCSFRFTIPAPPALFVCVSVWSGVALSRSVLHGPLRPY